MNRSLKDFIEISNSLGSDATLVQGGGGNTSVKREEGNLMYVKASGVALKDVNADQGYRIVDLARCGEILSDPDIAKMPASQRESEIAARLENCCRDQLKGRPSVETSLHALLGRCVAHTHPSAVNALLCTDRSDDILKNLYEGLTPPCLILDYVDFGYPLAKKMQEAIDNYRKENKAMPEVIFLKNHGLFVSGDGAKQVLELTRDIVGKAENLLNEMREKEPGRKVLTPDEDTKAELLLRASAELRKFYAGKFKCPPLVSFDKCEEVTDFMRSADPKGLADTPALVPDQQLYCNGAPVWVDFSADPQRLSENIRKELQKADDGDTTPVCVLVDGMGMFTAGPGRKLLESARSTMLATLTILSGAGRAGDPRPIPDESIKYIKESEWEKYRHQLLESRAEANGLRGKVAVISGAGSGLGRGIAIGLADEGMHVVLADIDKDGMQETAKRILKLENPGDALAVCTDVTDEGEVANLYLKAVINLGGVDLLVNCASIAPPLPLLDFSVNAFRKALDINLTGYMLMAREAARTMKRQGSGGNIINLSSKSALDASKNHSAYNATKSGELHMGRGWALELAEYGIRVNNVCPGNVFHESKIWNKEYIEALAEKRGLKPDEVIPYYIGLTALGEEITWDDIAGAVAFLAGPGASKITGQTLVVDAGQVFVR